MALPSPALPTPTTTLPSKCINISTRTALELALPACLPPSVLIVLPLPLTGSSKTASRASSAKSVLVLTVSDDNGANAFRSAHDPLATDDCIAALKGAFTLMQQADSPWIGALWWAGKCIPGMRHWRSIANEYGPKLVHGGERTTRACTFAFT